MGDRLGRSTLAGATRIPVVGSQTEVPMVAAVLLHRHKVPVCRTGSR